MTTKPETKTSIWRFSSRELAIVGAGVAVALVAILLAGFGGVPKAQPVAGAVLILGIAYLLSTNRSAIDRKTVMWGLGLQVVFALLVLKNE